MVKPLNFKLVFDYCLLLLPLFFLENIPLVKAIPITPTINKPIAKYNNHCFLLSIANPTDFEFSTFELTIGPIPLTIFSRLPNKSTTLFGNICIDF